MRHTKSDGNALFLLFYCTGSVLAQLGLADGELRLGSLGMFTTLSNVLNIGVLLYRVLHGRRESAWMRGACVVNLLFTCVVSHFILQRPLRFHSVREASFLHVHYLIPACMLADWIVYPSRRPLRRTAPLLWTLLPAGYLGGVLLYVGCGGAYHGAGGFPYPFLNPAAGSAYCTAYLLILSALLTALGIGVLCLQRVRLP